MNTLNFKSLKSVNLIVGFATLLVFTFTSCEDKVENPLATGTAPAFTLTSLENNQVSLSDYSNKVVVLFFFGNISHFFLPLTSFFFPF